MLSGVHRLPLCLCSSSWKLNSIAKSVMSVGRVSGIARRLVVRKRKERERAIDYTCNRRVVMVGLHSTCSLGQPCRVRPPYISYLLELIPPKHISIQNK